MSCVGDPLAADLVASVVTLQRYVPRGAQGAALIDVSARFGVMEVDPRRPACHISRGDVGVNRSIFGSRLGLVRHSDRWLSQGAHSAPSGQMGEVMAVGSLAPFTGVCTARGPRISPGYGPQWLGQLAAACRYSEGGLAGVAVGIRAARWSASPLRYQSSGDIGREHHEQAQWAASQRPHAGHICSSRPAWSNARISSGMGAGACVLRDGVSLTVAAVGRSAAAETQVPAWARAAAEGETAARVAEPWGERLL